MFKKSRLPIPIVKSRYLPTIGRLIGKTEGCLLLLKLLMYATTNLFSRKNMQEHGDISQHCEINIVLLVRSDLSTESRTTIKKLQTYELRKAENTVKKRGK
jgi:hypothetical protein